MKRDWYNRISDEDPSWLEDFIELLKKGGSGVIEHFAYDISEYLDHVASLHDQCESPIETALLSAILRIGPEYGLPIEHRPFPLLWAQDGKVTSDGLIIIPQKGIKLDKAYRADFLLLTKDRRTGAPRQLVIECDGHDFHEKTKQQAARDKSRDRQMTAAGYAIMRFTGSEIHKDAASCAHQACRFLARWR